MSVLTDVNYNGRYEKMKSKSQVKMFFGSDGHDGGLRSVESRVNEWLKTSEYEKIVDIKQSVITQKYTGGHSVFLITTVVFNPCDSCDDCGRPLTDDRYGFPDNFKVVCVDCCNSTLHKDPAKRETQND